MVQPVCVLACDVSRLSATAWQIYSYVHFDRFVFDQVIDTPPFQRLRFLSQLGACKLVYPSATHTRFEHSLGGRVADAGCVGKRRGASTSSPSLPFVWSRLAGVGDLGRRYFGLLAGRRSAEDFADESVFAGALPLGGALVDVGSCQEVRRLAQCVELAGLCHDLGHGPFSHAFEEDFINVLRKAPLSAGGTSLAAPADHCQAAWHHEEMSQRIATELLSPLIDRGGPSELEVDDVRVINKMIEGVPSTWNGVLGVDFVDSLTRAAFDIVCKKTQNDGGRPLTDDAIDAPPIAVLAARCVCAANKRTGLDVDRLDYLCRDAAFLSSSNPLPSISPSRILMHSKVIDGHICYNAKELHSIYQIFHARYSLFNLVYLHRKARPRR